jgi:hypothetical protein
MARLQQRYAEFISPHNPNWDSIGIDLEPKLVCPGLTRIEWNSDWRRHPLQRAVRTRKQMRQSWRLPKRSLTLPVSTLLTDAGAADIFVATT